MRVPGIASLYGALNRVETSAESDFPAPAIFPVQLDILILALCTRAAAGDEEARQNLNELSADRDAEVRRRILERRVVFDRENRFELIFSGLSDRYVEVRQEAIGCVHVFPDPRFVPLLAERLSDRSEALHTPAAEAIRACGATQIELLRPVLSKLQFVRTAGARDDLARFDESVRYCAAAALCYAHGCVDVQAALLEAFCTPELGNRDILEAALLHCPAREELVESLVPSLLGDDRALSLASLLLLGKLKRAELRPHFLEFLEEPDPAFVRAALEALLPLARPEDVSRLQKVSRDWAVPV